MNLKYNFNSPSNYIQINGRLVSEQSRISESFKETKTPGFGVWDLSAAYEVYENITLKAGVENMFNQWYYEHLNRNLKYTGMVGERFYEPGRNFYFYLKYQL
jgi:iron complex outermembrane receptor protein